MNCLYLCPSLGSQLARRLPARVQGYPWRLAYSTLEHGTSLKTLYRKSASLDSPVLLVIKDMDNQVRFVSLLENIFLMKVLWSFTNVHNKRDKYNKLHSLAGFCPIGLICLFFVSFSLLKCFEVNPNYCHTSDCISKIENGAYFQIGSHFREFFLLCLP